MYFLNNVFLMGIISRFCFFMRRNDIVDPTVDRFTVEDIVYHTRFLRPIWTWKFLLFMLYLPFGLVLLVLRLSFMILSEILFFPLTRLLKVDSIFYKGLFLPAFSSLICYLFYSLSFLPWDFCQNIWRVCI